MTDDPAASVATKDHCAARLAVAERDRTGRTPEPVQTSRRVETPNAEWSIRPARMSTVRRAEFPFPGHLDFAGKMLFPLASGFR